MSATAPWRSDRPSVARNSPFDKVPERSSVLARLDILSLGLGRGGREGESVARKA